MKRKVMALLLAATMAVTAGCGGANTSGSADNSTVAGNEAAEAEESQEETKSETEEGAEQTDTAKDSITETDADTTEDSDTETNSDTTDDSTMEEEKADDSKEDDMAQTPAWEIVSQMKVGWNLGNTLDAHIDSLKITDAPSKQETCWGNPETTQEMIDAVLGFGFNTIRIPVTWKAHIDENNNIDPVWMDRVQEVVDYAYGKGAYVIINVHHEDWNYPYYDNQDKASERLAAVWTQIADRFKDYDSHLVFELQNEPRKVGTDVEWNGGDKEGKEVVNAVNMAGYEAIRASEGNNKTRLIMFPGYAASSQTTSLMAIKLPENDDCVAVSVHAYTPYNFALEKPGRSTYDNDHGDLDRLLKDINRFFLYKNVPVIIGEFGAMNKNNESERAEWVSYFLRKAGEMNVPCIWWDNGVFEGSGETFGLVDRRTLETPYPELMKAMQEYMK